MIALLLAVLLAGVGGQAQQPCSILKRMGPADQITSHMYSFGVRGKQFQFVEGQLPKGVKFHGRLTDHDVRKIQDAGGKVMIIDSHYSDKEIEMARKSCSAPGAESPSPEGGLGGASAPSPPSPPAAPPAPAAAPTPRQFHPWTSRAPLRSCQSRG